MAEQNIPAEMLDAADAAISALGYRRDTLSLRELLEVGFKAAGIPALLAERDGLRARVAELEAAMRAKQ